MAEKIVILNPQARQGKALALCRSLQKNHPEIEVFLTTAPADAALKARLAVEQGAKVIIAAGGDGTINEVVNGIAGQNVTLGILPFGTVNVFARELGIPLQFEKAWQVIEKGKETTLDYAEVQCRTGVSREKSKLFFVQMAGIGLDAEIVRRVSSLEKKIWGPVSYVFQFFKCVSKYRPHIQVQIDGNDPVACSSALIGNGRYYAGPFSVFKDASPDDGHLDLCLFSKNGVWAVPSYILSLILGRQKKTKGMQYVTGRHIEMTSSESVPIEIDGEFVGFTPVSVRIIPQGLKVLVPSES